MNDRWARRESNAHVDSRIFRCIMHKDDVKVEPSTVSGRLMGLSPDFCKSSHRQSCFAKEYLFARAKKENKPPSGVFFCCPSIKTKPFYLLPPPVQPSFLSSLLQPSSALVPINLLLSFSLPSKIRFYIYPSFPSRWPKPTTMSR